MLSEHRVLSVLAHPDDESFLCAGTLAHFVHAGAAACVVSATRGEVGEIAEGVDATADNLGQVREQELRDAMAELGVDDVRFLGYRDSGMAGTADNEHSLALAQASSQEVGSGIVSIIEEFRPTILITFGPEGVYLHPDHVSIHHASMAAVEQIAGDGGAHRPSTLVFTSMPREFFLDVWSDPGGMFKGVPYETVIQMGSPQEEITHSFDVSAWLPEKRAALARHRSQFGDSDPLADFDPKVADLVMRFELFRQRSLPWDGAEPVPFPLGQLDDARARTR